MDTPLETTMWTPLGEPSAEEPPVPSDLVSRVRIVASSHPDRVAVLTSDGRTMRYGDLFDRAMALAPLLVEHAAERGIAVLADRGPASAVAVLAAAAAGCPLALLGVDEPAERVDALVDQLGLPVVVVDLGQLTPGIASVAARWTDTVLTCDGHPEVVTVGDPVLMMSTSGSTSRPKIALVSSPRWQFDPVGGRTAERQLVSAAVGSYAQLHLLTLGMWCGGSAAVFTTPGASPSALVRFIRDAAVTKIALTPTIARAFVQVLGGEVLSESLQQVNLRGERIQASDVAVCRSFAPNAEVFHAYASTEAAFIAYSAWPIGGPGHVDGDWLDHLADGVELRLRLDDGRIIPAAPGGDGELLVQSSQQCDGYVAFSNDGARNDGASDDLFVEHEGRRWVATGDRVTLDDAGRLRVLGRLGRRVKVAGMFVDLDEVAALLEERTDVAQAAVTWFDDDGTVRLVGHLIPAVAADPDLVAIRRDLTARLPLHSMPTHLRVDREPPLNPNGKLDHLALSAWRPAVAPATPVVRSLADPVETLVIAIASDLLGRQVGPTEDLVDAGFTSMDWLELVEQIRTAFDVELELVHVIAVPTPSGIAALIGTPPASAATVRLSGGSARPAVFWCPVGLAAQEAVPLARALDDRPVYLPVPKGFARPGRHAWSVRDTVDDMVAAADSVHPGEPVVIVGFSTAAVFAREVAATLRANGREVALLVLLDPSVRVPSRIRSLWWTLRLPYDRRTARNIGRALGERHSALFRAQVHAANRHRRHRSPYEGRVLVVRSSDRSDAPAPSGFSCVPEIVVLPDTGHMDVIADGPRLAAVIEHALASSR